MYLQNKVGIEAEFFLRDKNKKLVYPSNYGFSTDDFPIVGEVRADAGTSRHETVGNFLKELARLFYKAEVEKLTLDFSSYVEISPAEKAKILRSVGIKSLDISNNVYATDLLNYSDDVVRNGKVISSRVSAGFHIHLSRRVYHHTQIKGKSDVVFDMNTLTASQIKAIVRGFDRNLFPRFPLKVNLKYRQPGFYEIKPWGFEYRSLPMSEKLTEMHELRAVVNIAFSALEKLEK